MPVPLLLALGFIFTVGLGFLTSRSQAALERKAAREQTTQISADIRRTNRQMRSDIEDVREQGQEILGQQQAIAGKVGLAARPSLLQEAAGVRRRGRGQRRSTAPQVQTEGSFERFRVGQVDLLNRDIQNIIAGGEATSDILESQREALVPAANQLPFLSGLLGAASGAAQFLSLSNDLLPGSSGSSFTSSSTSSFQDPFAVGGPQNVTSLTIPRPPARRFGESLLNPNPFPRGTSGF